MTSSKIILLQPSTPQSSSRFPTTPLRRSARLNPTYADPPDINVDEPKPPLTPSSKQKQSSDVNGSNSKRRRQSRPTGDGSTYPTTPKRIRIKGEMTPDPEEIDGELLRLRRICEGLNINYSLFDDWIEDPRGRKIEDMKIPFLPSEIMLQIFSECRPEVLVECQKASKRFRDLLSGNTKIWRKARTENYPGLPFELPLGFDEEELFDMTIGKNCDYCDTKKKVRPYYIWGVRCCQECIQTLTLCASEFKCMLKKKVGDSSDWDAKKRECICHTIKWHDLPTGARLCWKEEAYARINEAEEVMLEDRFHEWFQEACVSTRMQEIFWVLEDWGADVPRVMKKDRDDERVKTIEAKRNLYKNWCLKVLPTPIQSETMDELSTYISITSKSGFLTKKEFILSLPRLVRDSIRFDDEARRNKALQRQYRLKHEDLLEATVQQVMHALICDGSAKNWGNIVKEKVKLASTTKIELRFPKDTPESVMRWWGGQPNDLGIMLLYQFAKLLEHALDRESSPYKDLLHSSVFEFFENGGDRIFTCHETSICYTEPTPHRCRHKDHMTLMELAEHLVEKGIYQQDSIHVNTGKWECIIKIATPPGNQYSGSHQNQDRRGGQQKITQFLQGQETGAS